MTSGRCLPERAPALLCARPAPRRLAGSVADALAAAQRGWIRRNEFLAGEEQRPLAKEFKRAPWTCDVALRPGVYSWNAPSKLIWDEGEVPTVRLREGRHATRVAGLCDSAALEALRRARGGALQAAGELFEERETRPDEVLARGPWRLERQTNGSMADLVLEWGDGAGRNDSNAATVTVRVRAAPPRSDAAPRSAPRRRALTARRGVGSGVGRPVAL